MKKKMLVLVTIVLCLTFAVCACGTPAAEESAAAPEQSSEAPAETSAAAPEQPSEAPSEDAGDTAAGESYTIGFIPMSMNNEFYIMMMKGAERKCAELGHELVTQGAQTHASAEEQLQFIETMLTSGIDAIMIAPTAADGMITGVQKCQEAGVPLINLDAIMNMELLESAGLEAVPFFGTDNYEGAKKAAEYVMENYDEGTQVAVLTGIEGQQNTNDRKNGFIETAGDYLDIVATQTANWEVEEGYTAAQNIISSNPDLALFFCSNDSMAIGALRAVQEANLTDQIKIIGYDAQAEAINLVKSGDLLGTVAQYPAAMGEMGVEAVVTILGGGEVPLKTDTGSDLITGDNVADYEDYVKEFE
ncbi:MAG: sugar ABC transporter substrate-binding protein [Christensenellaceae bacterium]